MSGSVSMVDGHIDPDKGRMTTQQAIKYFEDEILMLENAPNLNGCEMTDEWREQLEICKMAKQALEKQIPKKPMTQFEKLKQMNTDEAAAFISALADSCKDVARYGNQTVPYLVKLLLECEVEEE